VTGRKLYTGKKQTDDRALNRDAVEVAPENVGDGGDGLDQDGALHDMTHLLSAMFVAQRRFRLIHRLGEKNDASTPERPHLHR
jgi:hypothetical protein